MALCDLKQWSFGTDARAKVMIPVLNHTQGKCHAYEMIAFSSQPTRCDLNREEKNEYSPIRETCHDGPPNTKTTAPFLNTSHSQVLHKTDDDKVHSRREDG